MLFNFTSIIRKIKQLYKNCFFFYKIFYFKLMKYFGNFIEKNILNENCKVQSFRYCFE